MFDVFAGMGKTRPEPVYLRSKTNPDNTYTAREGDYLLTLTRLESFATREGQPRVSAEFRVEQVLRETPASHKAGDSVKELWKLDITPLQVLTDYGSKEMDRMASFFRAIFAQAGIEVTSENIGALAKAAVDATMANKPESLVGMQVVCSIYKSKPSKKTGKVYDEQKFSAPPLAA